VLAPKFERLDERSGIEIWVGAGETVVGMCSVVGCSSCVDVTYWVLDMTSRSGGGGRTAIVTGRGGVVIPSGAVVVTGRSWVVVRMVSRILCGALPGVVRSVVG